MKKLIVIILLSLSASAFAQTLSASVDTLELPDVANGKSEDQIIEEDCHNIQIFLDEYTTRLQKDQEEYARLVKEVEDLTLSYESKNISMENQPDVVLNYYSSMIWEMRYAVSLIERIDEAVKK